MYSLVAVVVDSVVVEVVVVEAVVVAAILKIFGHYSTGHHYP